LRGRAEAKLGEFRLTRKKKKHQWGEINPTLARRAGRV
jgi:hypothetical protein